MNYTPAVALTPPSVTPEQLKLSRTFDFNLEALRGFAAIAVVWHHVVFHQYWLDPHYNANGIFAYNPSGHLNVLVFFVLSGYVIGRVHLVPLARKDILPYIKKRFVRIYPIYLISVIFALVVARNTYPVATIIGNLTLTQNWLFPTIFENNPAWSLNFEILFYLLFIPLSFFRLNIYCVALVFAGLGLFADSQEHYLSGGYLLGFAFWLCGVIIARNSRQPLAPSFASMVSMLFLLLSLKEFNTLTMWVGKGIRHLINPRVFEVGPVQIADLCNLPYCVLLVLVFASINFPFRKYIVPLLLLLPTIVFYRRLDNPGAFQEKSTILPACFYVAALIVYFFQTPLENWCVRFIKRLSSTGAWSYGLYMIHFPIIAIFTRINWFSGTAITFSVRLLVYALLCFAAAYFLERKFQPWIKQFFQ